MHQARIACPQKGDLTTLHCRVSQAAEKWLTSVNRYAAGNHPVRRLTDTPPESAERVPHLLLDTEGVKPWVERVHPPRRGEN